MGGEGTRKGHTKSASISAAGTRHSDLPPLDTNIDAALKRSVFVKIYIYSLFYFALSFPSFLFVKHKKIVDLYY